MLKSETGDLLLLVQGVDNREVTKLTIQAWHEILHEVDFDAARVALADFRRTSNAWVTPADIIRGVRDPWAGKERFGGPE